ncbi:hypothetical protein M2323_004716 [Rhodoblastus acidophilus]|uniref:hypothetical protein n=1 Tax=Rhodoblastus acidophilus TaxID=1074 RepID=UPI002225AC01|nr:hypothetical protein [Rhodoblastus acidophilus]MCW2286898.1 hypothetical protein [Rhodoblastus acidophilus]MCW2335760.1 hypothetical protein [Rhodoblastus acidophilus]
MSAISAEWLTCAVISRTEAVSSSEAEATVWTLLAACVAAPEILFPLRRFGVWLFLCAAEPYSQARRYDNTGGILAPVVEARFSVATAGAGFVCLVGHTLGQERQPTESRAVNSTK